VRWPSGRTDTVDARAGERLVVGEGQGRLTEVATPRRSTPRP
jgi:hypothetical protein